ncbi:MAG: hypothetical protein ACYCXQ_00825 [Candidatus Humimicrobiaceae bacterium]
MVEINTNKIEEIIKKRAYILLRKLNKYVDVSKQEFLIGGNSLNNPSRKTDIDIFPQSKEKFDLLTFLFRDYLIFQTKNASTFSLDGLKVQICNYTFPILKDLVNSFDYSHIQIGVRVQNNSVEQVYFTDEYLESRIIGNSDYMGSNYPLSSLIRALKYKEYGELSKGRMIISVLSALADVVERGFVDYPDFKDQLDAVDLGILPEELKEFEGKKDKLTQLFDLLVKDKSLRIGGQQ